MSQLFCEIEFLPVFAYNWRPTIGDPTLMGWVTVALYLCAAYSSFRVTRHLRAEDSADRRFWSGTSLFLILLGVNKQIDLQSLLTEIGRNMAKTQGWYAYHHRVQFAFIVVIALAGFFGLLALLVMFRKRLRQWGLALLGLVFLDCFIIIRATSIHGIDRALGMRVGFVTLNVALECSGLMLILAGSLIATAHAKSVVPPASSA